MVTINEIENEMIIELDSRGLNTDVKFYNSINIWNKETLCEYLDYLFCNVNREVLPFNESHEIRVKHLQKILMVN
tara:strand:- start:559 stop:783 length:225 start_codon:yes stop_codon:yes gene_type:complete